ncbi:hypothetical protein [Allosphingosinicella sp.]|uniref:hypothetical protein n=1 Tax=Allosphingosinicella sp. TaxID=2823234 RepID=UPI002FC1A183
MRNAVPIDRRWLLLGGTMGGKEKSADDVKGDAISKLLAGDVAGFDKELQETMRGPAGADIRRDHLREHIADHLFNGDYDNATRVMGLPYAALGGLTIYEAAATHDGMLQVKTLVAKLEGGGFPEGAWSEDER